MGVIENIYVCFRDKCLFYLSRITNRVLIGPDIIQIAVTHRCNLRCKFCDVIYDSYKPEEELSTQTIKGIIDQFKELSGKKVFLVGGEPFLRKDFFELMGYANSKGLLSLVSTNGTLINEEMARKIVDLPAGVVMFSIEGGNAQTHDSLRGEKVFEKITNAIKLVAKVKKERGLGVNDRPMCGILSVVLNSNLEQLIDIIKLAESLEIPFINFQPLQTNNTIMWEKDTKNPEWIPEERYPILDNALDKVEEYKKKARTRVTCDTKYIKEYFRCNVKEPDVRCYMNYLRVVIKPNGKLWTCLRYHGDIYHNSLKDLWYSEEMKKDRIKSKQCNSLCLQRCIYLDNAENLQMVCENLLWDLKNIEKREREEIISKAIKFLEKQKAILNTKKKKNSDQEVKKKDEIVEIDEALKEIENARITFESELKRVKCKNNCQFCELMNPEFCTNELSKGNIFLLGQNQEIHDRMIGKEDSFSNAFAKLNSETVSIIIITKDNYQNLEEMVELIHNKRGKKLMFVFLEPKEGLEDLFSQLIPTVNEAAPYIEKAKKLAEKYDIKIISNPLPFEYKKSKDLLEGFDKAKPEIVINKYQTKKEVSIIIPTVDRKELLRNTLKFLFKQDFPKEKYEIVIVGDGSNDETKQMIKKLKPLCNLTYINWSRKAKFIPGEPMNRAGPVRNLGAKFSSGKYLIFIDDDILVKPDFIKKHLEELKRKDVVIGTRVDLEKNSDIKNLQKIPVKDFEREPFYTVFKNKFIKDILPYKCLYSCNLSISKENFLSVNGFDDEFVYWGLEDEALGYKLFKKGLKFIFSREAIGYHQYHSHESIDIFNKRKGRMYNHTAFYKKYLDWDIYRQYFLDYREMCNFEFFKSDDCNNKCLFCENINKIKFIPITNKESIITALKKLKDFGVDEFFDTKFGCEFTNQPYFFDIIKTITDLQLKNIKIVTNGRMFYYEDFVKKLPNNIMFEVIIYGPDSRIHDKITKINGSFEQTIKGVCNLTKHNKKFMVNIIICKFNYKQLPDIIKKFENVNNFSITIVPISSDFKKNLKYFTEVKKIIRETNFENKNIIYIDSFFNCYTKLKYFLDEKTLPEKYSRELFKRCYYCDFVDDCKGEVEKHILNSSNKYIEKFDKKHRDFSEEEQMQKSKICNIAYVGINLTKLCNYNCIMCPDTVRSSDEKKTLLKLEKVKQVLKSLKGIGVKNVHLSGGEPTLRKDFFEILNYANKLSLQVDINTNGSFNEKFLQKLVNFDVNSIAFSLDSMNPELHDKIRGKKGAFQKIIGNINKLKELKILYKNNIKIYVLCVIMGINLHEILDLLKFTYSLEIDEIIFQVVNPFYGVFKNDRIIKKTGSYDMRKLWVHPKQYKLLDSTVKKLIEFKRKKGFISNSFSNLSVIKNYFRKPSLSKLNHKCWSVNYLGIEYSGRVMPCWGVDWYIGNIKDKPLKEILTSQGFINARKIMKNCDVPCFLNCYEKASELVNNEHK